MSIEVYKEKVNKLIKKYSWKGLPDHLSLHFKSFKKFCDKNNQLDLENQLDFDSESDDSVILE